MHYIEIKIKHRLNQPKYVNNYKKYDGVIKY